MDRSPATLPVCTDLERASHWRLIQPAIDRVVVAGYGLYRIFPVFEIRATTQGYHIFLMLYPHSRGLTVRGVQSSIPDGPFLWPDLAHVSVIFLACAEVNTALEDSLQLSCNRLNARLCQLGKRWYCTLVRHPEWRSSYNYGLVQDELIRLINFVRALWTARARHIRCVTSTWHTEVHVTFR